MKICQIPADNPFLSILLMLGLGWSPRVMSKDGKHNKWRKNEGYLETVKFFLVLGLSKFW